MSAVTKDDLKSIAVTSAIAAAGTALATSIVEIVLTRYVLKDEEEGATSSEPTFVVVPVVDRPVPELPVAGMGSLASRLRGRRVGPMSHKGRRRAMSIAMRSAMPFGATSPDLVAQVRGSAAPGCYTKIFDFCLDDKHRQLPQCARFEPWHQLYDVDLPAWDREMAKVDFCTLEPRKTAMVGLGVFAGGMAFGALLYALGTR